MKMISLLVFIVIFPAVAYSQPSIVFDTDRYDFGIVPCGDMLEHTFHFTNSGDEELIIQKLVPS
ncbi:MAG: DUF1573 domain-containing protein [Nitrospirota bacterium]|nr:DUF1573 domain-containing protein [Nitrospirota bacterium]MDH5767782.1 DUF1573 domain-containing protein [Nitrospirota bacterium]